MDILKLLEDLRDAVTVSGFEEAGHDKVMKLLSPYFDSVEKAGVNGLLFTKKCGKEQPKKLLIDVHLDEIGMIVTDIKKDGLVTVSGLGGNDTRCFTAGEYVIHGKEDIQAVVVKKPYRMPGGPKKLPQYKDIFLLTGYTQEELKDLGVAVGTPISQKRETTKLGEEQFCGPYMDDKCCAVAALYAVELLKGKELDCDVMLLLSSQEESFGAGFKTGAFYADPDEILVVDVDLGNTPETDASKTVKMKEGPSVSVSIQTDRKLTELLIQTAKEQDIPCQLVMNVKSTGTNASAAPFFMDGAPCAVIGLPLKYMHTPVETLYEKDLTDTGRLIAAYIEKHHAWNRQ